MKRKTFFSYIGAIAVVLVVLVYMGYQVTTNLSQRIVTADAVEVTAEDKISTSGVFVRRETPVYAQAQGGTVEFLASDGEKVSKGQQIARFFSDENQLALYRESVALAEEIDSVNYAFTHMADGSDSVKLDSLIKMNLIKMGDKLDRGLVSQAEEYASKLDAMIIQRGVAQQGETDCQSILSQLQEQKASVDSQITGGQTVTSQQAGYFVGSTDGLEQTLTVDGLTELSAQQIKDAQGQQPAADGAIGKVVDDYGWFFAVTVDEDQAKDLKDLSQVTLRFPELLAEDVDAQVYDVHQDSTGAYVAVFQSGYMNANLLGARDQQVDIVLGTYTGIRVPKEALRQLDGTWGAYCLEGAQVVFKEVKWIFQTDSYYVAQDTGEAGTLTLYDKMVVEAKDIENTKVVK